MKNLYVKLLKFFIELLVKQLYTGALPKGHHTFSGSELADLTIQQVVYYYSVVKSKGYWAILTSKLRDDNASSGMRVELLLQDGTQEWVNSAWVYPPSLLTVRIPKHEDVVYNFSTERK